MPTYKYRREDGSTFTIRQPITADALDECPDTGQAVERVITGGSGFHLKGGGWYSDGYSSVGEDKKKESTSENGSESKKAEGSEGSAKKESTSDGKKEKKKPAEKSA